MRKYKDFFVVDDVRRFQKNPNDVEAEILSTAISDGKNVEIWMEQEPGSAGINSINNYEKLLSKFTFRGQKETGSKVLRASKTAADAGNGKIKILQGIWNMDFLDELDFFPDSRFKDQVDALSGAHDKLNNFVSYKVMPVAVGAEQGSYWQM
jgi:predicted phage terminase large subunit-like protein